MRKLDELYQLVIDRLEREDNTDEYICNNINKLWTKDSLISLEEKDFLLENFRKNRPTARKHKKFFNDSEYVVSGNVWWNYEDTEVRIQFLETLIKNVRRKAKTSNTN